MNQEPNTRKTDRELHVRIWGVAPNDPAGSDLAYDGKVSSAQSTSRAPRGRQKNLYRTPPLEPAAESSQITSEDEDTRLAELRESILRTVQPQIDEIKSALRDLREAQAIITRQRSRPPRQPKKQSLSPVFEGARRFLGRKLPRNLLVLLAIPLLLGIGATLATAYLKLGSIAASSDASGGLKELLILNGTAVTWVNLVFGLGSMFVAAGIGLMLTRRRPSKSATRVAESPRRA